MAKTTLLEWFHSQSVAYLQPQETTIKLFGMDKLMDRWTHRTTYQIKLTHRLKISFSFHFKISREVNS